MEEEVRAVFEENGVRGILLSIPGKDAGISAGALLVKGRSLPAEVFALLEGRRIWRLHLFLLSAGEEEGDRPSEQLRRILALTELAEKMPGRLPGKKGGGELSGRLSPVLAPGFYGMPLSAQRIIHGLLHGEEIGVRVTEEGLLIPGASLSGLILESEEGNAFPELPPRCSSCRGDRGGCFLCAERSGKKP